MPPYRASMSRRVPLEGQPGSVSVPPLVREAWLLQLGQFPEASTWQHWETKLQGAELLNRRPLAGHLALGVCGCVEPWWVGLGFLPTTAPSVTCIPLVPSIRSVMQKYLEDRGEVTFEKIFSQKLGEYHSPCPRTTHPQLGCAFPGRFGPSSLELLWVQPAP